MTTVANDNKVKNDKKVENDNKVENCNKKENNNCNEEEEDVDIKVEENDDSIATVGRRVMRNRTLEKHINRETENQETEKQKKLRNRETEKQNNRELLLWILSRDVKYCTRQKPQTFRIAAFHAQFFSGQSARILLSKSEF